MPDIDRFVALMDELDSGLPQDPAPEVRRAMAELVEEVFRACGVAAGPPGPPGPPGPDPVPAGARRPEAVAAE